MAKYRVTIEDRVYEVKVEELEGDSGNSNSQSAEAVPEDTVAKTSGAGKASDGTEVKAPLSGDILSVKVKVGQQVSDGEVLLTLEALKLENEITAPKSGTISQIVSEGETVETDQVIAIIS